MTVHIYQRERKAGIWVLSVQPIIIIIVIILTRRITMMMTMTAMSRNSLERHGHQVHSGLSFAFISAQ